MIVTSITKTNLIDLHIATNQANMVSLDSDILAIVPEFVDQTQIASWVATGGTNEPPHWTVEAIIAYALGIPNQVAFPPYSIQTTKSNLLQRAKVLELMVYTDDPASYCADYPNWAKAYSTNVSYSSYSEYGMTNVNEYNILWLPTNQPDAQAWWETNVVAAGIMPPDGYQSSISDSAVAQSEAPPFYSYSGLTYPRYSWSARARLEMYVGGGADHSSFFYGWTVAIEDLIKKYVDWSSDVVENKMTGSARVIPIARTDYYYYDTALLDTVAAPSNVATTVTSAYATPLNKTWGVVTASASIEEPDQVTHTVQLEWTSQTISKYAQTNIDNSASYTSPYVPPRHVIHKWDVERCVP